MDNVLSTSFDLRPDMSLDQIYQDCIYNWLRNSRNYDFRELPQALPAESLWSSKFFSKGQSVECTRLQTEMQDSLGVELCYTDRFIKWVTRVAIRHSGGQVVAFVSLQRECTMNGISIPTASSPRIVSLLMEHSLVDGCYAIQADAHVVEAADVSEALSIFRGRTGCRLPIIYMSVSRNTHCLIPEKVARQMQGLAHIVKECDPGVNAGVRSKIEANVRYPQNGEIGIYYPDTKPKILQRRDREEWVRNPQSMVDFLFKVLSTHSLLVKSGYTWETFRGDVDAFMQEQFRRKRESLTNEKERLEAENAELARQINAMSEKIAKLERDNDELVQLYEEEEQKAKEVPALHARIASLQDNLNRKSCGNAIEIARPTNLEEMFPDEFLLTIMLALKFYDARNNGKKSGSYANRSDDVIAALTAPYQERIREYELHRDNILGASAKRDWKNSTRADLEYFGMVKEKNEIGHSMFYFVKDEGRYRGSGGGTNSDKVRGYKNEEAAIDHAFFMKSR